MWRLMCIPHVRIVEESAGAIGVKFMQFFFRKRLSVQFEHQAVYRHRGWQNIFQWFSATNYASRILFCYSALLVHCTCIPVVTVTLLVSVIEFEANMSDRQCLRFNKDSAEKNNCTFKFDFVFLRSKINEYVLILRRCFKYQNVLEFSFLHE